MKYKKYHVLIFDLDGTLIDSKKGIIHGYQHALEKLNVKGYEMSLLYSFLGPPLQDNFRKHFFQNDSAKVEQAVLFFKEYMRSTGVHEATIFPGIVDMLRVLKRNRFIISLATSKAQEFADGLLSQFQIHKYFSFVTGVNADGSRSSKSELIAYVMKQYPGITKDLFVMIGDREHDMIGACENGIDSIGVLYGYGAEKELKSAGATMTVHSVKEIEEIFSL
ncbi:MAG: HAD hydrolase-like protein [Candidatus Gottesmanbacteria bacterium]|nr:HAD hydrolase-like protein [Candidatus Gottesmanbacteria bacterium]